MQVEHGDYKFFIYLLAGLASARSWDKKRPQTVSQRSHALPNGALQVQRQSNEQGRWSN